MDILYRPVSSIRQFYSAECRTYCETRGNAANGLMEETSVAGSQFPNQLVHGQFECFRMVDCNDPVFVGLRYGRPLGPVKLRIEVVLANGPVDSIENVSALLVAQFVWS